MELNQDSSPALSERASMMQRITRGTLVPPQQQQQPQQQQLQNPNVVPAPAVDRVGERELSTPRH
eukprot:5190241-Prorocentrum_lima.AAC.1